MSAPELERPRMTLLAPPIHPDEVTLLDWYAAAVLMAKAGSSSADIFDKAAAMVAESHKRKGLTHVPKL